MNPDSQYQRLRFDVFGRIMVVDRREDEWLLFNVSPQGLLTRNTDVAIPAELIESELAGFLDDMYHESSSIEKPVVIKLD